MSQISNLVIAYDTFIKGCKADGIWDAIKACCIMSGWDGLNGALTPLKGTAPTNFNFVSGDYDRKTGLVGDGLTKYLRSNYTLTSALQNNRHLSLWVQTPQISNGPFAYAGSSLVASTSQANSQIIALVNSETQLATRLSSNTTIVSESVNNVAGFQGISRSISDSYTLRAALNNNTISSASIVGNDNEMWFFARNNDSTLHTNSKLSFYSIGEALDLAALDYRVSTLMTTINSVIP